MGNQRPRRPHIFNSSSTEIKHTTPMESPEEFELIDLFEHYDRLPEHIQVILNKHSDDGETYENCENLLNELRAHGYTFDYYLDAQPYNLRKFKPENIQECIDLLKFLAAWFEHDEDFDATEELSEICAYLENVAKVEWMQEDSDFRIWCDRGADNDKQKVQEIFNRIQITTP